MGVVGKQRNRYLNEIFRVFVLPCEPFENSDFPGRYRFKSFRSTDRYRVIKRNLRPFSSAVTTRKQLKQQNTGRARTCGIPPRNGSTVNKNAINFLTIGGTAPFPKCSRRHNRVEQKLRYANRPRLLCIHTGSRHASCRSYRCNSLKSLVSSHPAVVLRR